MAYKALIDFIDLQDEDYLYKEGETYPRKGKKPSKARIEELASEANRMGYALIVEVKAAGSQKKVNENV